MNTRRKKPKKLYPVNWLKTVRRKKRVKVLYKRTVRRPASVLRPSEASKT